MKTTGKNLSPGQVGLALVTIGLLLVGVTGCAAKASAPPAARSAPTDMLAIATSDTTDEPPAGWATYTSPSFSYTIGYPAGMEGTDNGDYSWTLAMKPTNPENVTRNFIYVSVIPVDFKGQDGDIYNYNKPEADILLNMQVGETKSLRDDKMEGFTYTRKPDTTISGQVAKTYENTQPWEFPAGTKEIRYYLQTDVYTYLIGGYVDTTGANQPGIITEELFNQIIATFRVTQ